MKFSIITPSFNMERWIAQTIESVLSQAGDFEIEFILQDGASSDNTVAIFEEYRARLMRGEIPLLCQGITMQSFSEKDKGTSDAINRGFTHATGDIYTWVDADNTYVPGAFAGVAAAFKTFPEIQWLKGYSSTMNEAGKILYTRQTALYRQDWLRDGIYGVESYYVNADTVFWIADLWKKAGPIPDHYRCAGECWLWIQMAKRTPLWSMNHYISVYRKRDGQLSKGTDRCRNEKLQARGERTFKAWQARLFFSPQSRLQPLGEKFFFWLYPLLYMWGKKQEYVDFESGVPVKKQARSFIIGEHPSFRDITPNI